MAMTIDSLQIEVSSSSKSAVSGLNSLKNSLNALRQATAKGVGLNAVIGEIKSLNSTASKTSTAGIEKLEKTLSKFGATVSGLKISSSIGNQIKSIADAANKASGAKYSSITQMGTALRSLEGLQGMRISSSIGNQLKSIGEAIKSLDGVKYDAVSQLVEGLKPLETIGQSNLGTLVGNLKKIPDIVKTLDTDTLTSFAAAMQSVTNALTPLASTMGQVSSGFSRFPQQVRSATAAAHTLPTANGSATHSYANLAAKIGLAYASVRKIANAIGSAITAINDYVEDMNLFNASMGEYATQAQKYANRVGDTLGINPGEWMRNQGVFMNLATGFGIVSDRAYIMSQNLTQLGYDISSFFNIPIEESMQRLQSGISGEIEPMRRLGYDLSQARLEAIAASLGIQQTVSSMNQAEKAQLRYYAIMTQVTTAQGDMARTLEAPANQIRVLQAQITQAAQAFGSVFIPILNAALPYVIALAKAVRLLAAAIASLFGFTLPDIDYSGISNMSSAVDGLGDSLGNAGGAAKKLKNYMMGFDELNVIDTSSSGGGGGGGGSGGGGSSDWDWDLPSYDFIGDAVASKVDELFKKFEPLLEWVKEHLGEILSIATAIGAELLMWKISSSFMPDLTGAKDAINKFLATLATAATVAVTIALVYTFDNQYLETGKFGYLIADGIATALGSAVAGLTMGGQFGTTAGWYTASATIAISAVTSLLLMWGHVDESGFDSEAVGLSILGTAKLAIAGALAGKALGTSVLGGAFVGVSIGASITALVYASNAAKKGNGWETLVGSVVSIATGAIAGGLIAAGIGASIVGGAVVGGVITASIAAVVLLNAVRKSRSAQYHADWGKIELTAEEVRAKAESLFTFDVAARVNLINSELENLEESKTVLNTKIETFSAELNKVLVGAEIDETSANALIDSLTGSDGVIASIQNTLSDGEHALEVMLKVTPPMDENGNEMDAASILTSMFSADKLIEAGVEDIGQEMARLIMKSTKEGLTSSETELLASLTETLINVSYALQNSSIASEFAVDTSFLLKDVTKESFLDIVKEYKSMESELLNTFQKSVAAQQAEYEGRLAALHEIRNYYIEQGNTEMAEATDKAIAEVQRQLEQFDAVATVAAAMESATAPGSAKIAAAFNSVFKDSFKLMEQNNVFGDGIRGLINVAMSDYGDLLTTEPEILADEIEEWFAAGLEAADLEYILDIAEVMEVKGWDLMTADLQQQFFDTVVAAVGYEPAIAAFGAAGYDLTKMFANGMLNGADELRDAGNGMISVIKDGVEQGTIDQQTAITLLAETLGEDTIQGFLQGADGEMSGIISELASIFGIPITTAQDTLETHSPSKVFEDIGGWVVEGLLAGLMTLANSLDGVWDALPTWAQGIVTALGKIFAPEVFSQQGAEAASGLASGLESVEMPTLQSGIELIKNGWETVKGWLTGEDGGSSKLGGEVEKSVGLTAGFGSALGTVAAWLLQSSIFGGNVEKPVDVTKGNWSGPKGVAGYIESNDTGGNVTVAVDIDTTKIKSMEELTKVADKIKNAFSSAATSIQSKWNSMSNWFGDKFFTPVTNKIDTLSTKISATNTNTISTTKTAWNPVALWFETNLFTPLKNKISALERDVTSTDTRIVNATENRWRPVALWFETNLFTPLRDKLSALEQSITVTDNRVKNAVENRWRPVAQWFQTGRFTPLTNYVTTLAQHIEAKDTAALSAVKTAWTPVAEWFKSVLFAPVTEKTTALAQHAETANSNLLNVVKTTWTPVAQWFETSFFSSMKAKVSELETAMSNAFETAKSTVQTEWSTVPSWFNAGVKVPLVSSFATVKNELTNALKAPLDSFKGLGWYAAGKEAAQGLANGLKSVSMPKFHFSWKNESRTSSDGTTISVPVPNLRFYKSGGFPEMGELFVAREAGPEMVGSIGRRTAVANNSQIVSGIANGVAEANSEQNALLREQNSLLRALLEKESGLYLDGKSLSDSIEKYQKERGRVLVTGGAL